MAKENENLESTEETVEEVVVYVKETNSMMFRKALRECLLYYLLQDLWLSHSLDFQVLFKRRTTRCQV